MPLPDSLRKLLTAPGPSGYEQVPAAVFREAAAGFGAQIEYDSVGSTVARVAGTGDGPTVAVVGHIDEIGLIVHHIDDDGYLWFTGVGGWDPIILVGQRVTIATREGPVVGVVGRKAIHLLREEDRKKVPELRDLHIDIGARDGDEARARLRVGDVAVVAGEPFEVADGVTIPTGAYHYRRFRLEGGTAAKRRLSAQATWWFGTFYDGRLNQYELTGGWRPSALVIVEFTGERDVGRMPEGSFAQDLVGTRLRVNVSPDLQLSSFLQYDTESQSFGTNTRLRWTFHPLGDLFVVYNHNLRTRDPVTLRRELVFASNQLLVKVQYAFRY
jgi:endoglucanase